MEGSIPVPGLELFGVQCIDLEQYLNAKWILARNVHTIHLPIAVDNSKKCGGISEKE